MKTLLVLAGVALIGYGIYEYMGLPENKRRGKKAGCGCGDGKAGAGGSGAGGGSGVNSDGSNGGTVITVSGNGAVSTIPGGSASVDDVVNNGGNPVESGPVGGAGSVSAIATAAGGGSVVNSPASAGLGGGVNNPWGGNVPDVNNNFVYAAQDGGPDNSKSYPNMVQRFDASKQATVSPPITTISGIPGGSASVQEMSWDKSVLLVKG